MTDERQAGAPPSRKRTLRMSAAVSRNDEFLFHLHRGSAFLMAGDVHGAKVELEHALAFQPQDAKSQDLLAGVYFRLGLYPRAIEIWEEIVGIAGGAWQKPLGKRGKWATGEWLS
ncbi:MAG: hypothetical protein AAF447_26720 [Myxococcota bacterium]